MMKIFLSVSIIFLVLILASCKKDSDATPSAHKIPTDGLILFYPFDGNCLDSSIENNDGLHVGTINYGNSLYNKALLLKSGQTGYIKSTKNPSIESVSFTISCFIKTAFVDGEQCILQRGCAELSNSLFGYCLAVNNNNVVMWVGHGGGYTAALVHPYQISNNTWNHIVITYDITNNTLKLFMNGVYCRSLVLTMGNIVYYNNYDNGFTIGRRIAGPHNFAQFDGNIDQLRIYNRVLTTDEIKSLLFEE